MIILSTNKTSANDYFANTQMQAIVHMKRLIDASENGGGVNISIDELGKITDVIAQMRQSSDSDYPNRSPNITITGNVINISAVVTGDIYTIFAIGTR
jgi:hypothetical protein